MVLYCNCCQWVEWPPWDSLEEMQKGVHYSLLLIKREEEEEEVRHSASTLWNKHILTDLNGTMEMLVNLTLRHIEIGFFLVDWCEIAHSLSLYSWHGEHFQLCSWRMKYDCFSEYSSIYCHVACNRRWITIVYECAGFELAFSLAPIHVGISQTTLAKNLSRQT